MKCLILFALLATAAIHSVASNVIYNAASERIIQGAPAGRFDAPHYITYRFIGDIQVKGGGAIISPNWVLTAAHISFPIEFDVIAGIIDIHDLSHAQIRRISQSDVYKHEEYTMFRNPHDVAVVHINVPFEFNAYVNSIAVATSFKYDTAYVYGFGMTEDADASEYLRYITTKIVGLDICEEHIGSTGQTNSPSNICAYSNSIKSSCGRDSGSPYSQWNGTAWTVIAIVSWGDFNCQTANTSSVIVDVANYATWIHDKITNFPQLIV